MEPDYVKLKVIKPALTGYIADSQMLLKRSDVPDEEAVHDIRVLMKKARGAVRLLNSQVVDELFIREKVAYREIGRMLSLSRETSVQRRTLKFLKKENPDLFERLDGIERVKSILKKPEPDPALESEEKVKVAATVELLDKAAHRLRFYALDKLDPQLLLKELERTYILASDNYLKCRLNHKPASLHEFRKRSKDFLYQLYFFRALNPSLIKDLEKKLDILTQNLGRYNDLSQVISLLDYERSAPENFTPLDELLVVIRDKQDEYLSKVWPLAYKIFCPGKKLVTLLGFKLLMI